MPNVVLITIDCLRRDHCGFAGYSKNTTPNIDSVVPNAYQFTSAISPGPRTSESFPGILSGRLSAECEFIEELAFKTIPDDAETLASFASSHGYQTLAAIANPQLSPIRGFANGFDSFENLRIEAGSDKFDTKNEADDDEDEIGTPLVNRLGRQLLEHGEKLPLNPASLAFVAYRHKQLKGDWASVSGQRVVDRFLSSLPDEGPFFAWTHLNDIHAPIHPGRVREGGLHSLTDTYQFLADAKRARHEYSPGYEALYDGAIRYVDKQVGRILDHLEKVGLREETAIIITADHGEALYDRGIYGHASGNEQRLFESDRDYLYRELLDVPLLVDIPGEDGDRIDAPFSLLWLHQLLAEIMGVTDGEFPQHADYAERIFDTESVALSDSLLEDGHTIAVLNADTKIITDATSPNEVATDNWHYLSRSDAGDRTATETRPEELIDVAEASLVEPGSLYQSEDAIHTDTMQQLADLGYK
ncbi:sulfatase [Halogeometricum sp. S1BR25-6]|uniref:Sulfatase n=1 Tax=Halogeometricum salsisoli TaxID=2950536 RepID=A0ABU2GHG4_9EURY|nr:sulfatase [Halogeometricum sp. S1BR25-6]MDS0300245.1 sulfatase [Halogeometricum sp. S1BR25-6]